MMVPLPDQVLSWSVMAPAGLFLLLAALAAFLAWERQQLRRRTRELDRTRERLNDEVWELRAEAEARGRAEAASEAKSRFLATVSHEIRTPLNGIVGMADLLSGTPLSREQQSYLTVIKTSGGALTMLIDEILDLARIESGRLDLKAEPFDLAALVEGVIELMAPRAQDKGLEIAASIGRDLPSWIVGDALRLRQVLTNLADNAVKFTVSGGVGVRVSSGRSGAIVFSVADTGPGVPTSRRAAIFEEFEQADGSTTRRHGGSGLGLAIAKRIIAGMGGDLGLQDREGGGSVFSFAVSMPEASGQTALIGPRPALHGKQALIVSPGPFQAQYLREQLAADNVTVLIARTLGEAVEIMRAGAQPPALLFVDCALGEEAARGLAVAAQSFAVSEAILLFSPAERHAFGQQLASGFDSWLVKPVRSHSLAERLHPPVDRDRRGPARGHGNQQAPAAGAIRVLVAEDNPINALIARTALERCGAVVTQADDGFAALKHYDSASARDRSPFDLILMDVSMPGLDGLDVTRRIRLAERNAGVPAARIVAMTAHAFETTLTACRQAGMDDVLTKPINPGAFRTLVERPEKVRVAV